MTDDLTMREAIERYRAVYKRFEKIEGRPWGLEGAMIELSKQVGDLSKLVMVEEGYYFPDRYESSVDLIGDELADIFAAVIRIADYYKIDFVDAHIKAREAEERSLPGLGG
jgi:NTP pyrophosphatase (non-canonical NTP hydrolase)